MLRGRKVSQAGRLVGLVSCALWVLASGAFAEDPKPKHKDSRLLPPEVSFETRVVPEKARPGDTVRYEVTVKVEEPWHIYAWAGEQPDKGPRATQFELFDTGGLKPVEDAATRTVAWSGDPSPITKAEPAFGDLVVDYYTEKVVWSVSMKVPADAKPGEHIIKNQIYFQICNDTACKPPTYATVPAAKLAVLPAAGQGALAPGRWAPVVWVLTGLTQAAPETPSEPEAVSAPAESPAAANTPAATAAGSVPELTGDVARDALNRGPLQFILTSVLAGLFAMLMPCVWPMIPITVSFFVKQGEKGGRTLGLALAYCASIVGVYTIFGLILAVFFGAQSGNKIAVNPWINLAFALAFTAFGLSLLGLFEMRLPSFLLNASSKGEARGGLLGVFFMALTLTITSFTCTAPLVGGLVVMAATGSGYLYPVLGLFIFSLVLALPFFLLALMPGKMASLPRSGDWMNSVKVVGGLLELAAALKFFNQFEVNLFRTSDVFIDAQIVLSGWVVIACVCGIYLLGVFRTDHDLDQPRVGPVRLLSGTLMLMVGLYLAPALFGYPPRGQIYETVVGILPPDAKTELNGVDRITQEVVAKLNLPETLARFMRPGNDSALASGPAAALDPEDLAELHPTPVKASSSDPKIAITQEREVLAGLSWRFSYDDALARARAKGKPVLIDFTGVNCANCRTMEDKVLPNPAVVSELKNFVLVRIYTDFVPIDSLSSDDREVVGEDNLIFENNFVGQTTSPLYVIVNTDGAVVAQKPYDPSPGNFVSFLKEGLAKARKQTEKVATR